MREKRKLKTETRLLNKQQAAAYCGVGVASFDAACRVQPVILCDRIKRWDREALDEWIDGMNKSPRDNNGYEWDDGGNACAREGRQTL